MSDHLELVAEVLRDNPHISEAEIGAAVRAKRAQRDASAPTPVSDAWQWANTPLVSPDFGDSFLGKAGRTVAELATTPANLAGLGLGLGASAAGARGLMGISRVARGLEAGLQVPLIAEGAKIAGEGLQDDDPLRAAIGGGEAVMGALGVRGALSHSFPMDKVAGAYNKARGLAAPVAQRDVLDPVRSRAIADAYEAMPHAPNDPAVAGAYGALGSEVSDQFAFLRDKAGMRMEPWTQAGQPYANSAAMTADVRDNNHLWYFPTEGGYGDGAIQDNPLLKPGRSGRPLNDEFRAVHDAFGHATRGHQFGPRGEDLAWQEHRQMFSPEATRALTTETRGQNSWVNYGPQMRGPDGALLKKGDPGFLSATERAYAPQKTGLLPEWAAEPEGLPPAAASAAVLDAPAPPSAAPAPVADLAPGSGSAPPEELLRFTHRSPLADLTELDADAAFANPSVVGIGAELARKKHPGFVPRTYVTPEDGFVEHRFRGLQNVYEGEVPKSRIYPLEADPENLKAAALQVAPNGGPEFLTAIEAAVRDAGYQGYQADHAVALFGKHPVRRRGALAAPAATTEATPTSAAASPHADSITRKEALVLGGLGAVASAGQLVDDHKEGGWDDMVRKATAGVGLAAVGWFPKKLGGTLSTIKREAKDLGESAARTKAKNYLEGLAATGNTPPTLRRFSPLEQEGLHDTKALPARNGVDFDKRVPFTKTLVKQGTNVRFSKFSKQRMDALYEIGTQQPVDWGKPDWIGQIAGWDVEKTVQLARLLGTYSPGTPVNVNTAQALEAFLRIADGEDAASKVFSRGLKVGKPLYPGAVADNAVRASKGGRIFAEKTEALAGGELGSPNTLPVDRHFLRAMGSAIEKTPGKGSYRAIAEAAMREAHEKGVPLFPYMATVWTGIRDVAGYAPTSFVEQAKTLGLDGLDLTNPKNRLYMRSQLEGVQARLSKENAGQALAPRPDTQFSAPPADLDGWRQQVRELFDQEHAKGAQGDVLGKKQQVGKKKPSLADIAAEFATATGTDDEVPF